MKTIRIQNMATGQLFDAAPEMARNLVSSNPEKWKLVSTRMPKVQMKAKGSYTPPPATT